MPIFYDKCTDYIESLLPEMVDLGANRYLFVGRGGKRDVIYTYDNKPLKFLHLGDTFYG